MRAVVRHFLGWGSLALGVVGLVLPILQGWLFIGIGAVLLAPDVPLFARLVCWVERRFPRLKRLNDRLHARMGSRHRPDCGGDQGTV